jgi:2-polyprenyl-3-methyl-5-hydroxy-6-metoxy-1,4-benzoquinol methylase
MKKKIIKIINSNEYLRKKFLGFSLWLNDFSYSLIKAFITPRGGLHPKHAIMNYHQFFLDNIASGDKVLDIGCGNGAVAYDIASKAARVIGVDIAEKNIKMAKEKFQRPNLEFIAGNCLEFDFAGLGLEKFDKIILSNVLEHLTGRVEFLQKLHKLSETILLRVPLINRDWLAVYKKEHGYKYKLSSEHEIEYTEEILADEFKQSGWKIEKYKIIFGEFWGVIKKLRDEN